MKKLIVSVAGFIVLAATTFAQGTAFTYQGRLNDGPNPANGSYDLTFALFDAAGGGAQQGGTVTNIATGVTNGLFSAVLDFGNQFTGAGRWLEIGVRTNGGAVFSTLTPRQLLTATPYAVRAAQAGTVVANAVGNTELQFASVTTDKIANSTIKAEDVNASDFNSTFWRVNGNSGTSPSSHFLGTTDNQSLQLRVNNVRALLIEPRGIVGEEPNLIGGSFANSAVPSATGATIGGGGAFSYPNYVFGSYGTVSGGKGNRAGDQVLATANATVGGGFGNVASGSGATVGGGSGNTASGSTAAIAGGSGNSALGDYSAVVGGYQNLAGSYSVAAGGSGNSVGGGYSAVGGGANNTISGFAGYAVIAGGSGNNASGSFATIGGGAANQAVGPRTFVGGGNQNYAIGDNATVGGGENNSAGGVHSSVLGGKNNSASYMCTVAGGSDNTANSSFSSIGGGYLNSAAGGYSVVPGGTANAASGNFSLAAGQRAKANHAGTFVWSDSVAADFASTSSNQFLVRASGGVGIGTTSPGKLLQVGSQFTAGSEGMIRLGSAATNSSAGRTWDIGVPKSDTSSSGKFYSFVIDDLGLGSEPEFMVKWGNGFVGIGTTNPVELLTVGPSASPAYCNGTTWVNGSDRNAKQDFAPVDAAAVLERVVSLPVQSWSYKAQPTDRHIGPMAQDFHAAFQLNGDDNTHIATVDEAGVALAAIQGLNTKLEETRSALKRRDAENAELKQSVAELKELVSKLLTAKTGGAK